MKILASSATAARAAGLGVTLLFLSGACVRAGTKAGAGRIGMNGESSPAEAVILTWPEGSRATARAMIAKYGEPGRVTSRALRWTGNGPWEKTIVHRSAWPRIFGYRDKDYLEQTVAYRIPPEKVGDVMRFDERLEVNESGGQMSACSPSEPLNFLLLNLAREIASGERDIKSAREFYRRTEELEKAGKSSPYAAGLLFPSPAK